jgi:putative acetyltransferase
MTIRPFIPADANPIIKLIQLNLRTVNSKDYPLKIMEELARTYTESTLIQTANQHHTWVYLYNDIPIGTITLIKNGRICNLFVHPEHHLQGVGKSLLKFLEKFAQENRFQTLTVEPSITARLFYQKMGYTPISQTDRIWKKRAV